MKLFNAGARPPAGDDPRLSAANELVRRTLAQHGLLPGADAPGPGNLPAMGGLMGHLPQTGTRTAPIPPAHPEGAVFDQDTYTCAAGTRRYRTYVPASAQAGVTGIVLMLHGCTQSPEDFASGTGMNALAEKHRFVVVYPAQSRGDNAQSCWNWFSKGDQRRGCGEPAILAGLISQVCAEHGVDRDRTFVAGLSAGAAMAAILGETYPDVFAAVGAHSGLPAGAARDVPSAFAAMRGSILDAPVRSEHGPRVRTIIFHGTADATVNPDNGDAIRRRALAAGPEQSIETSEHGQANGRRYTRLISSDPAGTPQVELWRIEGQGHAWSGGSATGTYADPKGPDASAEMVRFFFNNSDEAS
ncbi:PHB depolymerase family esterase [Leisingera caerulea]|uniref:extracellular catalytic domain type 1 short-chain-length polyhydroxyalkanoate depolymerase n=1 Tax=Leisingera caerulea TaxID=506591 RepID=UPI0021A755EB|nr:PHB depolymerase family esterase [Leisingera caerulea]UWQ49094.1 PHB depolymerase family esterase [Leisingera caerulea]